MALMQQLRKNPQIRGIILLCMTCLPIVSNDHCCLSDYFCFQLCRLQTATGLLCSSVFGSPSLQLAERPNEPMFSFPSPPLFLSLCLSVSLCLSPSFSDMQLAGRGTKENKCSMKAVEEMLESMQITMSQMPSSTPSSFPPVHPQPHGATWQLKQPCDVTRTGSLTIFFFVL